MELFLYSIFLLCIYVLRETIYWKMKGHQLGLQADLHYAGSRDIAVPLHTFPQGLFLMGLLGDLQTDAHALKTLCQKTY